MIQKYLIHLSNKATIQIDEDEVSVVVEAIKTGKIGRVRQGIFNPSFFVSMTIDHERIKRWNSDNTYRNPNEYENRELALLPDIFAGQLPEPNNKQLKQ